MRVTGARDCRSEAIRPPRRGETLTNKCRCSSVLLPRVRQVSVRFREVGFHTVHATTNEELGAVYRLLAAVEAVGERLLSLGDRVAGAGLDESRVDGGHPQLAVFVFDLHGRNQKLPPCFYPPQRPCHPVTVITAIYKSNFVAPSGLFRVELELSAQTGISFPL